MIAAARHIIEQLREAEQAAAGEYREPRGELSVTLPVSFGEEFALPVVLEFLKAHPEVQLRIMFADRSVNLVDEQLHVALRIGVLEDPTLVATRVGMISAITCASPAFLERFGAPQRPEDLPNFDGITFKGFASLTWRYQRDGKPIVAEPRFSIRKQLDRRCHQGGAPRSGDSPCAIGSDCRASPLGGARAGLAGVCAVRWPRLALSIPSRG